jgi:hypothetical protein
MVQLEDLDWRAVSQGLVQTLANELTTERCDLAVEEFEASHFTHFLREELAYCSDTLVFAVGFPKANTLQVRVPGNSQINIDTYSTAISESVIAFTPSQPSSSHR